VNLSEMADEFARLSRNLDKGIAQLTQLAHEVAQAEADYRRAKSRAFVEAPKGTVPEREAWVNAETADLRQARDLADGLRQAALEAVRSRRTQISALQTLLNAHEAEADFSRTGRAA